MQRFRPTVAPLCGRFLPATMHGALKHGSAPEAPGLPAKRRLLSRFAAFRIIGHRSRRSTRRVFLRFSSLALVFFLALFFELALHLLKRGRILAHSCFLSAI